MAFDHVNSWLRVKQRPTKHAEIYIFYLEPNGIFIGNVGKAPNGRFCVHKKSGFSDYPDAQ